MKNKKLKTIVRSFWFIRTWNYITRDRSKCPVCRENPKDPEYNGKCFNCYYKQLTKNKIKE